MRSFECQRRKRTLRSVDFLEVSRLPSLVEGGLRLSLSPFLRLLIFIFSCDVDNYRRSKSNLAMHNGATLGYTRNVAANQKRNLDLRLSTAKRDDGTSIRRPRCKRRTR